MDVTTSSRSSGAARVLVVADWAVDPHEIVAACRRRAQESEVRFGIVVPALLHGVDLVGDPHASRPCAARQLEALARLAAAAGLPVERSEVGDPAPTSAIDDLRADYAATEILLCMRPRRFSHPFDLVHRIRRASGLTVRELPVGRAPELAERRLSSVLRVHGHCAVDVPTAP